MKIDIIIFIITKALSEIIAFDTIYWLPALLVGHDRLQSLRPIDHALVRKNLDINHTVILPILQRQSVTYLVRLEVQHL